MKNSLKKRRIISKMKHISRTDLMIVYFIFLLFIISFSMYSCSIQEPKECHEQISPNSIELMQSDPPVLNRKNAALFFNEIVPQYLNECNIVGLGVSLVKDNRMLFSRGYGLADIENEIPYDAEKTLFDAASVSKSLTASAVMQLVEQGKIDLYVDVNAYLGDFKIPDTFPEPITMHHLLTHTAGFEDAITLNATDLEGNLRSYEEILKNCLPARIWKPGEVISYSNFGLFLAGYIIQRISGRSFELYVEENILEPLGMEMSTFRQPIPLELTPYQSKGYSYQEGTFHEMKWGLSTFAPAGSLTTSVTDMAKFMIAQLNGGSYNGKQVLKSNTVREMQSARFVIDDRFPGVGYGFWEDFTNNYRAIEHDGMSPPFYNRMVLIPSKDVGIYVAFNTYNPETTKIPYIMMSALDHFQKLFMDHFFPKKTENSSITPVANFQRRVSRFTGEYRITIMPRTSIMKSTRLFVYDSFIITLSASQDGILQVENVLTLSNDASQDKYIYLVEIDENVFQEINGDLKVIFIEDENGRIVYAYSNAFITYCLEKLEWYQYSQFHYSLLFLSLFIFFSIGLGFPISFIVSKFRRLDKEKYSRYTQRTRLASWISSLLNILTIGLYLEWLLSLNSSEVPIIFWNIAMIVPIIAFCTSILSFLFLLLKKWKERKEMEQKSPYWSSIRIVQYSLFFFASLSFLFLTIFWNLI